MRLYKIALAFCFACPPSPISFLRGSFRHGSPFPCVSRWSQRQRYVPSVSDRASVSCATGRALREHSGSCILVFSLWSMLRIRILSSVC